VGDDLAQLLFEALQAQGPEIPPFRRTAWHELEPEARLHWDAVAAKARKEMHRRFLRDMRDAVAEYGAEKAIANLLEQEAN
jgi:hypothetical protein